MQRGMYNSSSTRVVPVFEAISPMPRWVYRLVNLAVEGAPTSHDVSALSLDPLPGGCHWGASELALPAPVALLSWLVRNLDPSLADVDRESQTAHKRKLLAQGDPATIREALHLLRSAGTGKAWHVLEGPSYPDAFIETADALVVVEGKRTERTTTTSTTWLPGRHQIWRHVDGAWEQRGRRAVLGLLIVEGNEAGTIPAEWIAASKRAMDPDVIERSFPHRSPSERRDIVSCFRGVTTWQAVCREFGLNPEEVLLDTVLPMPSAD